MSANSVVWPEHITIDGIDYRHHCHPTGIFGRKRNRKRYDCPCGRVWYSDEAGAWTHQENNLPTADAVKGILG